MEKFVILNNIRSSENVGAIFRTCDATLVSKIYLCGYTPSPKDIFGRYNKKLIKASLGAEKFVEWETAKNLRELINKLKQSENFNSNKFLIVGVEQSKKAVDYKEIKYNGIEKVVLIFGNEVEGLSEEDLELCDIIAQIPMSGKKESLNVSVCAGIILYSF